MRADWLPGEWGEDDERRGWGEILLAAMLQGAIFALVKAAVDRRRRRGDVRAHRDLARR